MRKNGLGTRWVVGAYIVGAFLAAVALLPEYLAGSSPGFGPMQICAATGAGVVLLIGTILLFRTNWDAALRQFKAVSPKVGKFAAKLLLCVGSLAIVAVAAEGWARWRAKLPDDQRRWLELIKDLPEAGQLAKDRGEWNNFAGLEYHDYYLYQMRPRQLPTSTFTSFFGDRPCPSSVPEETASHRVWFFGGSTMMNLETTDERTIANNAIMRLNESRMNAAGHNFGTGMFQSCLELAKFQEILRRVPESQRPTIVVFYDGFNDANCGFHFGAGRMQSDVSGRLQMLVERHHWDMVRVGVVEGLFDDSQFYQDYGRWLTTQRSALTGVRNDASKANLDQSVDIYRANAEIIRGICRQFRISPIFVLQPLVVTKRGRSPDEDEIYASLVKGGLADFVERFYAKTRAVMADCPEFADLSHILDDDARTDFYDLGHTGPYTGQDIGKAVGDAIMDRKSP